MALKAEVKEYIQKLAQTYGLDEKVMLKKAEDDENAAKLVDEGLMLRSDYSRKQDELARARAEADASKAKQEGYYQTEWLPKWNQREQEFKQREQQLQRYQAEAAAYRALYGDLEGFQPSAPAGGSGTGNAPAAVPNGNGQWVSVEQYQKDLQSAKDESLRSAGYLAKEVSWLTARHLKDFQEPLDLDKFEEFAAAGRYSGEKALRRAYEDFVKPQVEERRKVEEEARINKTVEERFQQRMASAHLPVDTGAPSFRGSPIFHPPSQEDQTNARLNDPNTPGFVKDDIMRSEFLKDLGNTQLTGKLFTGR